MFEHFRNLFHKGEDAAPQSAETGPASIDVSDVATTGEGNVEELDRLYREALQAMDAVEEGCERLGDELPREGPRAADTSDRSAQGSAAAPSGPPVAPRQILEAALFVGGGALTLKKLCWLLQDEFPPQRVEAFIDELNVRYEAEGRPYEIRFGKGGYRMVLRSEFDEVRNRVYGLGPKEIKLSQDALEVLSLVAYEQPVSNARVLELRGGNSGNVLRQLLRRELIALERIDGDHKQVLYRTTPRFLQAFGLRGLEDLPQADDLAFK